jgi:hypothetical protein
MKKTIDGVRYDTEKSELIGSATNPHCEVTNDLQYWEAALYVTPKSKKYFLVGEGGAMSPFSRQTGQNSWSYGERLIPMNKEDALEWAETYLDDEEYEEYFESLIDAE